LRPDFHLRAAQGWLLVIALLVAALFWLLPRSQINSSVLALLPQQQGTDIPQAISEGFTQRLDRQLMWLVSPPQGAGVAPLDDWLKKLRALPALSQVEGPMDAQRQQEWGTFFFRHRNALLDDATRQRLTAGAEQQSQWILGQLY